MKDLKIYFAVVGGNELSELKINTEAEHTSQENIKMIQIVLNVICSGLKQYHEKQS